MTELFGYIAATLTTISFLPQVIKIYKTNNINGLSLKMYLLFFIGVLFWLIYGIMLGQYPIVIANFITLILSGFILFKIIQKSKD